jgi:phage shock protein A
MGIFDRMSRLIKSNVNAKIDKVSDPAKQLDQIVLDLEEELRKNRGETAKIIVTEKRLTARLGEIEKQVATWNERAEMAVRAGDDALAREALERKIHAEAELAEATEEAKEAKRYAEDMREALKANEARLKEIKMKKGAIKAKVATTRNVDVSAQALDDFERVAGKVDDSEAEVEAHDELAELSRESARDAAVEEKFRAIERKGTGGGELDARLAALKAKMSPTKALGDGSTGEEE